MLTYNFLFIVLQLLQKGADPNHMDREGRTSLIAAAHTGCVKTVEVLLDHEASVNHADSDGRTALAVCILSESLNNHLGKNLFRYNSFKY
jgi:ankyrin repeat protein